MKEQNNLSMLYSLLRIRRIEEALAERYAEQEMRCPMHLCIGQEAIAVGVCAALSDHDVVYSSHRAHGHYLAKGGCLKAMIAELYGRSTGCCGGRGGSMHLIDLDVGFMGSTPIVGGTLPLAVGSAWAASLKGEPKVSVIFFGDGCFEEGVVHESINFAALHNLPIIFVCENNKFSVYTPMSERQADRPIHQIAKAHGLTTHVGDGNNVITVHDMSQVAVDAARRGQGPQFLELTTFRWREHCGPNFDDHLGYRTMKEIKEGREDCPIDQFILHLKSADALSGSRIEDIEAEIQKEISDAFKFALSSNKPSPNEAGEKILA